MIARDIAASIRLMRRSIRNTSNSFAPTEIATEPTRARRMKSSSTKGLTRISDIMQRFARMYVGGRRRALAHLARAELVLGRQNLRRGSMGNEFARQHQRAREVSSHRVKIVQNSEHSAALAVPAPHHIDQVRHRSRVNGCKGLVKQDEPCVLQ